MGGLIAIGAVLIAVTALVMGDHAAAVGAFGVGALAAIVALSERSWRLHRAVIDPAHAEGGELGFRAFENELRRERRTGRRLALVRVVPQAGAVYKQAERTINESLRTTDICFARDGSLFVAMPEACRGEADQAVERLMERLARVGGCSYAIATYPDDALTANGLIAAAQSGVAPVHSARG